MKLVTAGGALLALALPLALVARGLAAIDYAISIGILLTIAGALYWAFTCGRRAKELRRRERLVVWSAMGMALCCLLLLAGGILGTVGFVLWWVAMATFVVAGLRLLGDVRRMRQAPDEAALEST